MTGTSGRVGGLARRTLWTLAGWGLLVWFAVAIRVAGHVLLDPGSGLVVGAETVFPAMETGAVVNFGAILLFGYAVVLLTGFVPGPSSGSA